MPMATGTGPAPVSGKSTPLRRAVAGPGQPGPGRSAVARHPGHARRSRR